MKPHAFDDDLLARPHAIEWCADVFTPAGAMLDQIPIETGAVTLSGRDRGRTRGDITLVDIGGVWDPDGLDGASPYGGHVQMCAILFGERVYVAGGLILEAQRQRPEGTIRVAFVDYGSAVVWDLLAGGWAFDATMNLRSTIESMMEQAATTETIVDPGVPTTLAGAFVDEQSRESVVAHICTDANIVCWVDEWRRLRLQPATVSALTPAVYVLRDGPLGTVTSESHTLSRDGVPSFVVVTGERPQGAEGPVFGMVSQTTGPTAVDGPFGRVVSKQNRPVLTTVAECEAAGHTILARESRLKRDLSIGAVTHPALEPGDRVDTIMGNDTRALAIDEIRFRMGVEGMDVSVIETEP